jgi:hypothetical protein
VTVSLHLGDKIAIVLWLTVAGCGGDDEPPLTDATSLECPFPGDLPFRLESHGFRRSENRDIAAMDPRSKDEASDVIGNPGGPTGTVYLRDDEVAVAGAFAYRGIKARTQATQGLFANVLPGESVTLWHYDEGAGAWSLLDRGTTDEDGAYSLAGETIANGEPVYSMLEADGSCAVHRDLLLPPGSKFVVMDIDGTLTTDDGQLLTQITDEDYVPAMMTAANTMAKAWAAKGYPIIYLTARGHVFDSETRAWLDMFEFPTGALITTNGENTADVYKTAWLERMITTFGWTAVAAYGNAPTDITAYANAQIPLDRTFIVGPEAGNGGTVAIPNMDYTQHVTDFVAMQPDNH